MVARFNASRFRSKMNQAISKYNQAVRKHNQDRRRAIIEYNQAVRRFNAEQRTRQQRIRSALNQLAQSPVVQPYSVMTTSTHLLGEAYVRLEEHASTAISREQGRFLIDFEQIPTGSTT